MVYDRSLVTASCCPNVVVLIDLQLLDVGGERNYELTEEMTNRIRDMLVKSRVSYH